MYDSMDKELLNTKNELKKVKLRQEKTRTKLQKSSDKVEWTKEQIKLQESTYITLYILQNQEMQQQNAKNKETVSNIEEKLRVLQNKL